MVCPTGGSRPAAAARNFNTVGKIGPLIRSGADHERRSSAPRVGLALQRQPGTSTLLKKLDRCSAAGQTTKDDGLPHGWVSPCSGSPELQHRWKNWTADP